MSATQVDVAVIGGGPGGYVAALRAASHGMRALVVERDRLGGVCANEGCIPTKTLLRSAEVLETVRAAASFGVKAELLGFDFGAIVSRSRDTARRMEKSVAALLRGAGVEVIRGPARLDGPGRLRVEGDAGATTVEAAHIVLATGARPRIPAAFAAGGGVTDPRVWTSREAIAPESAPRSLLVVGAGAIGVELASFYRSLGVEVTLVEALDRVLPQEDEDVSAEMARALSKRGIRIVCGAKAGLADAPANAGDLAGLRVRVASASGEEIHETERVLLATGIVANTEGLGLEGTGVRLESGRVVVDEWLRTGEPGVYAIGDLTGGPWLAHKASREATICIDGIAGVHGARPLDRWSVPACTYSTPQVASVGLTEAVAKERGFQVRCGRAGFVGNGKARALGETSGFVKVVFDEATGELLGAHLLGPEVTELVATFAMARTAELTEAEILATVFPHPTLSEALHEAVEAAFAGAGISRRPGS